MTKKLFGILIALCMVFSMLPMAAFATDNYEHSFESGYYTASEECISHSYEDNLFAFYSEGHYPICDICSYYDEDSLEAHYDLNADSHCDI